MTAAPFWLQRSWLGGPLDLDKAAPDDAGDVDFGAYAHRVERDGSDWFTAWSASAASTVEIGKAAPELLADWFGDDVARADGDRRLVTTFTASAGGVDRMGDIVDQRSWRLKNFRANPVILAEHQRGVVVGRAMRVRRNDEADALEIDVLWDDSPANPLGQLMAHQHANRFRNAGSVGFRPGKAVSRRDLPDDHPHKVSNDKIPRWQAGFVFSQNELLEFSAVSIPAHPKALVQAADDPEGAIRRHLDETVSRSVRDQLLEAVRNDDEIRRALLALSLSTPQPAAASDWFTDL